MGIEVGGLLGFIILILDIIAIIKVASSRVSLFAKVLWALLILFLPVLGLIIWFFIGPKGR